HRFIVSEQLAALNQEVEAVLLEPFGRNTAPAVAMAAMQLLAQGDDELMLVLPADHVILDEPAFHAALDVAREAAEQGELVVIGITPQSPETGYGYIKSCAPAAALGLPQGVAVVERFVEKPDLARATAFLNEGGYYWNSGMFLFRASRFLEELRQHDPDIYQTCSLALEKSRIDGAFIRIDAAAF